MKYFFIFAILLYQRIFSGFLKTLIGAPVICRYVPSCSEYAKESLLKQGVIKGSYLSMMRILSCQPFNLKTKMSKVKTTAQNAKLLSFTL